jgi:hypothetical protein
MFIDKAQRAQLTAKLIEVRRDIAELHTEQLGLNREAVGTEGNRHAFIGAQLRILRDAERELNAPLLDAMEDDIRDARRRDTPGP